MMALALCCSWSGAQSHWDWPDGEAGLETESTEQAWNLGQQGPIWCQGRLGVSQSIGTSLNSVVVLACSVVGLIGAGSMLGSKEKSEAHFLLLPPVEECLYFSFFSYSFKYLICP